MNKNYVYDVVVEDDNRIRLDIYESYIETRVVNNKRHSSHAFSFIESKYPIDLEKEIYDLRYIGYKSITEYKSKPIEVKSTSVLTNLKLKMISRNFKVIDKVFERVIINNHSFLKLSIIYIDMLSGKIKDMEIANIGMLSDKIDILVKENYKFIEIPAYIYSKNYSNKKIKLVRK